MEGGGSDLLPPSSGKYGEVLVVVDTAAENGSVGVKLEEIFYKALDATPQKESEFRMSTVHPKAFKSILKRSRNLLRVSIEPENQNKVNIDRNVWASDQLLININANSEEAAYRILDKNKQTIRDYFNEEELKRLQKQYKKQLQKELMTEIVGETNIKILIPPAFVRMESTENALWLKKEKSIGEHQVIQGVMIYRYPYESDTTFSNSYMIPKRDEVTSQLVQGSREGSFMIVYDEYNPVRDEIILDGRYAVEYKGLWKMKNDFMGGSFIHYSFVDEERQEVVNLDGFVYAPKFNKREYLRELEAILTSVELKP